MKKIGVVIGIICAIITAISILGIITANRGKVESIDQDQLRASALLQFRLSRKATR